MPVESTNTPRATYRFQFHEGFTLRHARALVPYLHRLGISHVYASPLFKARPHSKHGYDACDFNQLNPELGTEADLAGLVSDLRACGMGLVLDIVPNHMGIGGRENNWWWDVLEHGPESPFAKYFDIDWNSPDPRLRGKLLTPVLGDRYNRLLAKGELKLEKNGGAPVLRYGENTFPLTQESLAAMQASPEKINSDPATLDALIEQQHYRLAWHGCGDSELNYRRFFNITSLAGLCMEREEVFHESFSLLRQWLERGWLDGLRVDHPDGLRDPEQFLQRLRALAPKAWIVVEKILEPSEALPPSWPVAGTTGYDFLNHVSGLFIDKRAEKPLTDLYLHFAGSNPGYAPLVREKKRQVLLTLFRAEAGRLTSLLLEIASGDWQYRDFTRAELSGVLIEWIASLPIYRTYARPDNGAISPANVEQIRKAKAECAASRRHLPAELFDFVGDLLELKYNGELEGEFVARFQQLSSAAMAKGAEDTAFYCYNRFIGLNEVGGDPGRFGVSLDEFHRFCQEQQSRWPETMLASSTHDTKRSEDVRARLALLSEMPEAWRDTVGRWSFMNKRHRLHGWPDRNVEYLFYQTLVGAWPLGVARALAYMEKATREAKEFTSWSKPDEGYDAAVREFVTVTMVDPEFMSGVEAFVRPLLQPACVNSLSQTLLKLAAPAVPDFYQGCELPDFSLVDPDNRRAVDFSQRQQLLEKAAGFSASEAWKEWETGLPKIWLIQRVLNLRVRQPELFAPDSQYEPMRVNGEQSAHAIAFRRGRDLICVAPRLVWGLKGDWRDTCLDLGGGAWRNELTDEELPDSPALLSTLLARFPAALLVRRGSR